MRAYIERHGRDGAARLTLRKWTLMGAVLAGAAFFADAGDGLAAAAFGALALFGLFAAAGSWRARTVRRWRPD